jgi:DNA invertase Pin-like site-specific DNA recombinase
MFAAFAQFERELMLERQKLGIAKAKAEGKYRGRKPTARAKAGEVQALKAEGMSLSAIAKQLGIGKTSAHRILASKPVATGRKAAGRVRITSPAPIAAKRERVRIG